MTSTAFEHLGSWASQVRLEDVPDQARTVACRAIVDYVGVTFAARTNELTEVLTAYGQGSDAPGGGHATVIGQEGATSPETAAFVNGATGHALDFDDSSEAMAGHPSIVLFPAALATGEQTGASGAQVLEGYIAGFEVAARIGRAVHYAHYERGWHPTATVAAFGAAIAAARIRGLGPERTTAALGLAASLASGIKANFGSMAKPIQAGRAAQNGVFAAHLASLGATANARAFEADQGFAAVHQGLETVDLDRLMQPVGPPWELLETGVSYKRYPCCASTHGAIEAAFELHPQLASPDDIEAVRIWTHPRRLQHTNRSTVSTGFEAKFSVQYTVAAALLSGEIGFRDFTPESIRRREVTDLMTRVVAAPMPEERWGTDHYPSEVEVTLRDGRTLSARTERPKGIGKDGGLSEDDLRAKFLDCAREGGREPASAQAVFDQLIDLAAVKDLGDLEPLLRGEAQGTQ